MMDNRKQLKPDNPMETTKRLFSYFKYNKALLIGGIFFIIVGSLGQIGFNFMLSPVIDALVENKGLSLFIRYLTIMGVIVVILSIGEYLGNLFMVRLAQSTVHMIRKDMFSNMEQLPIYLFDYYK